MGAAVVDVLEVGSSGAEVVVSPVAAVVATDVVVVLAVAGMVVGAVDDVVLGSQTCSRPISDAVLLWI